MFTYVDSKNFDLVLLIHVVVYQKHGHKIMVLYGGLIGYAP